MERVLQFLKENPTFFLATEEGDQARVRPFGAICEFGGKLYLITSNTKKVFKQIQANPKVELCGADQKGNWLRVEAKAYADPSRDAKVKMLEDNPNLKAMYNPDDGVMEVLRLEEATATFASFTAPPEVVKF